MAPPLKNHLRLWGSAQASVNDNHPLLFALDAEWQNLRLAYQLSPNEQTRYQLTRLESLIAQWAPDRLART